MNGSDIAESIRKGAILYLSKEIPIKRISIEEELSRTESKKGILQRDVEYKN